MFMTIYHMKWDSNSHTFVVIGTDSIDRCKSNYQYDERHRGPTLHGIHWDHGKQCQISEVTGLGMHKVF
jgi:hypothetical protein